MYNLLFLNNNFLYFKVITNKFLLVLLVVYFPLHVFSQIQDSVPLSLDECKAILIKENLSVIASHYDVDIAEAQVIQSRAWNNPVFNWNQDMYSVEKNQYFNFGNQFLVQIDIVFSIAGKYTNTVRLAKVKQEGSKLMVKDILRSLMMELNESYNLLNSLQNKALIFKDVSDRYDEVIFAGEKQLQVGGISANELIRLRSERIALQTEAVQNSKDLYEAMANLRVLLNLRPTVYIQTLKYIPTSSDPVLSDLFLLGEEHRADYLLSRLNIKYQETNLKLQKSLAVPDINFGYQPKDRGSNYVRPYSGIEIGFEVPLFNRNIGNIKASQIEIKKAEVESVQKQNSLQNEITQSFLTMLEAKKCLKNYTNILLDQIELLNKDSEINYLKRNINMLEYIDLKRIYIQNRMQFLELDFQYLRAVNHLNFSVGLDVIK
jgi:cobalt-zinc-cadmium efflux system outer membrane protein